MAAKPMGHSTPNAIISARRRNDERVQGFAGTVAKAQTQEFSDKLKKPRLAGGDGAAPEIRQASRARAPGSPMPGGGRDTRTGRPDEEGEIHS